MHCSLFINFNGTCREAVKRYADVFGQEEPAMVAYGDSPEMSTSPVSEEEKNLIMYTELNIFGMVVMFSDTPKDFDYLAGNNINPSLICADHEQAETVFNKLAVDGRIDMELQKTLWSPLYGIVEDKFGVIWHISYEDGTEFAL